MTTINKERCFKDNKSIRAEERSNNVAILRNVHLNTKHDKGTLATYKHLRRSIQRFDVILNKFPFPNKFFDSYKLVIIT